RATTLVGSSWSRPSRRTVSRMPSGRGPARSCAEAASRRAASIEMVRTGATVVVSPAMNEEARVDRTDYRAAVYGSVLVAALLGALDAEHADPQAVVASLLATTFVFWIAHVWA